MQLCRFRVPNQGGRIGLVDQGLVYDLSAANDPRFATLGALLAASTTTPIPTMLQGLDLNSLTTYQYGDLDQPPADGVAHILPPVDEQEVWAAGVTYAWSREARVREAVTKDIYVRVYEAERPELFFKSTPDKAVGSYDWIGIRGDSQWNVPEPELVLVLNPHMQIVGYTVGNDVSSRDIEGENPLYLPQAKMYRHSCALGPVITLADSNIDAQNLPIRLSITRGGAVAFEAETSTAKLHRPLNDLANYLGRYNDFPSGALLFTGTGIVPPDDFTLYDGDEVMITIDGIGTLHNVARLMT